MGEPPTPSSAPPVFLAAGFRPFFSMASAFASIALALWLAVLFVRMPSPAGIAPMHWHGHEMVFGFGVAVIAGFLLTAVRNWTSRTVLIGWPLAALAAVWLLPRIGLAVLPVGALGVAEAIDLAFIPLLIFVVGRPLWAARSKRQIVLVLILGGLWAADLRFHFSGNPRGGLLLGVDMLVAMMVVMTGRIVPMFTRNATGQAHLRSWAWMERLAIALVVVTAALRLTSAGHALLPWIEWSVAAVTLVRMIPWGMRYTASRPMLWILHLGAAWIPIGFALRALAHGGVADVSEVLGTHAHTTGALGTLTLGMMARVSLGHTGRAIEASRLVTFAFVAILSSGYVRALLPLIHMDTYRRVLTVSGILFSVAFAAFSVASWSVLTSPRVDGRPG